MHRGWSAWATCVPVLPRNNDMRWQEHPVPCMFAWLCCHAIRGICVASHGWAVLLELPFRRQFENSPVPNSESHHVQNTSSMRFPVHGDGSLLLFLLVSTGLPVRLFVTCAWGFNMWLGSPSACPAVISVTNTATLIDQASTLCSDGR